MTPLPSLIRRRCLLGVAGFAAGAAWAQTAPAVSATWPTRPVRIVVGFAPGSSPDFVARTLADPLSKALGQPVFVENHAGASGNIAADIVAKSTDRHTIGMLINGNLTIARVLNPATPYDPQKDLVPVSLVCTAPLVLAISAASPARDAKTFFDLGRRAGNRWSYGTPGIGTIGHLGMEVLKAKSGLAAMQVPYQGNPQVITAMIGGEIDLALLPPGLADVQVRAGKLRAIGVTSAVRSPLVPDIPTLQDAGITDFELEIWTAAAAPSSLPVAILQRLSDVLSDAVRLPTVRDQLFRHGYQANGLSGPALVQRVRSDTALLGQIIASQNIRLE